MLRALVFKAWALFTHIVGTEIAIHLTNLLNTEMRVIHLAGCNTITLSPAQLIHHVSILFRHDLVQKLEVGVRKGLLLLF